MTSEFVQCVIVENYKLFIAYNNSTIMTNIDLKHNIVAQCDITRLYICSTSIVHAQIIETVVTKGN